jgi:hypothetical protein
MPKRTLPKSLRDNSNAVKMVADAYRRKNRAIPALRASNYKQTAYYKRIRKIQQHLSAGGSLAQAREWLKDERI